MSRILRSAWVQLSSASAAGAAFPRLRVRARPDAPTSSASSSLFSSLCSSRARASPAAASSSSSFPRARYSTESVPPGTFPLYPVSPRLHVPPEIKAPPYVRGVRITRSPNIEYKTANQIQTMRKACKIASYIRAFAGRQVRPGVTTDDIDRAVHAEILRLGVYPSPLGYQGFPKSLCTSVNQVVCHGIPSAHVLQDGDTLNLDVSVFVDGYHGDCSGMFEVGASVTPAMKQMIAATKRAMDEAIAICAPGVRLSKIGDIVQAVADEGGYGTVDCLTGHGIGKDFHMAPHIFHCRNTYPGRMEAGMVFTIEPILTERRDGELLTLSDGWTMVRSTGGRSAQFEHTIVVTEKGHEVLTQHDENDPLFARR